MKFTNSENQNKRQKASPIRLVHLDEQAGFSLKNLVLCICCLTFLNMTILSGSPEGLLAQDQPLIPDNQELDSSNPLVPLMTEPEESENGVVRELPILKIEIEGNVTIPSNTIKSKLRTPIGRRLGTRELQRLIRDDIRNLHKTRWFFRVESKLRNSDGGLVLVFSVLERPVVQTVEYKGYKKIKLKRLQAETGLKQGSPFDVHINRDAARHLEQFYHEKGYSKATVKLVNGNKSTDRKVVFVINEGPKQKVTSIRFENNKLANDAILRTKLRTKRAILWTFGGKYDPATIEDDYRAITNYYHGLGHFDLKIDHKVGFSKKENRVYITYVLDEGPRYKVRNREIRGNKVLKVSELENEFELKEGEFFNERFMNEDLASMRKKYGELGRLKATVDAIPVFFENRPGEIDLVYQIDEDRVYTIRKVSPHILGESPHTKRTTLIDRMVVLPGDLADPKKIQLSKTRIAGSQLFERIGPQGVRIDVKPVEDDFTRQKSLRGQNAEMDEMIDSLKSSSSSGSNRHIYHDSKQENRKKTIIRRSTEVASVQRPRSRKVHRLNSKIEELNNKLAAIPAVKKKQKKQKNQIPRKKKELQTRKRDAHLKNDRKIVRLQNEAETEESSLLFFREPVAPQFVNTTPNPFYVYEQKPIPVKRTAQITGDGEKSSEKSIRGQNFDGPFRTPGNPIYDNNPQGNPYNDSVRTPPGEVDLDVYATEAQTGRLMFGVGVNSDAGVVGSIVLSEQNFDITRWPTHWGDRNAFRGGGQSMRIEAVPGNEVSRYMISWVDPYFMGTYYSLGVSGFHFTRFYSDWDELRTGGRVSLGHQFSSEISGAVALRMENVEVKDPDTPTPQILADSVGTNFLSTIRPSISHDTRDSAFLPSEGHFVELGYEQAFGDFSYPRIELEGKQHFTVFSRPDGGGRHTVTVSGRMGWTGDDTPIFERYFAGGFQTFRGFSFRGVSPREMDVKVGGGWLALGSVEYMVPLMANESIHGVAFTDFGTVEDEVGFNDVRVTAGLGLRITIPAMGPAPLAFDFAWPLSQNEDDDTQLFSFYIGFQR